MTTVARQAALLRVGITGTRIGCTQEQLHSLNYLLEALKAGYEEFHFRHGCCKGVDRTSSHLARQHKYYVIGYPSTIEKWTAVTAYCDLTLPPAPSLMRNKAIIDESDILIGVPKETYQPPPARGQGTWSAIRYAQKNNKKPVLIIWPDGSFEGALPDGM